MVAGPTLEGCFAARVSNSARAWSSLFCANSTCASMPYARTFVGSTSITLRNRTSARLFSRRAMSIIAAKVNAVGLSGVIVSRFSTRAAASATLPSFMSAATSPDRASAEPGSSSIAREKYRRADRRSPLKRLSVPAWACTAGDAGNAARSFVISDSASASLPAPIIERAATRRTIGSLGAPATASCAALIEALRSPRSNSRRATCVCAATALGFRRMTSLKLLIASPISFNCVSRVPTT